MKYPYKIARQEHLGDLLDALRDRHLIEDWSLRHDGRTAVWTIEGETFWTREAEQRAVIEARQAGSIWRPVEGKGGQLDLAKLPASPRHCWRCGFSLPCATHADGLHPQYQRAEHRHQLYGGR